MEQIKLHLEQMSSIDKELLASTLLDEIQKYYEDPENRRRADEWIKKEGEQQFSKPFTPNSPQK